MKRKLKLKARNGDVPEACRLWFAGVDAGLRHVVTKLREKLSDIKQKECADKNQKKRGTN